MRDTLFILFQSYMLNHIALVGGVSRGAVRAHVAFPFGEDASLEKVQKRLLRYGNVVEGNAQSGMANPELRSWAGPCQ